MEYTQTEPFIPDSIRPGIPKEYTEYIKDVFDMAMSYKTFDIKDAIFNPPATIVKWADGTKTVVKVQEGDDYSKETGLAMCIAKRALGDKGRFNNVFRRFIEGY